MGTVSPASVPTVADVERVANVATRAGAVCVVLFGSVARGEAHQLSDIDLMVIYDDVDYCDRHQITAHLARLAGSAVDCPVDIYVTDRPEWKMRTQRVCTSFESRAKRQGMVLMDHRPDRVDWGKEMIMPTDDYEEAVERLLDVARALGALTQHFTPSFYQLQMQKEGNEMAFSEYEQRLVRGCAAGQLIVETALKSLIHLGAAPTDPSWGHDIGKLLPQLTAPHRSEIEELLTPVGVEELASWQQKARYGRVAQSHAVTVTPELFRVLTGVACAVAAYTVDQFDHSLPVVAEIQGKLAFIEHDLKQRDLYTGADAGQSKSKS